MVQAITAPMKLKLTIMLDEAGIIQNCEYIKKISDHEKNHSINVQNDNNNNIQNSGRAGSQDHERTHTHNYGLIQDYDYEFDCPQSVIQAASSSGAPDLDGLFKLLGIDKDKKVMFVIVNKKITFSNSEVKEGDHIELLPAIDGG